MSSKSWAWTGRASPKNGRPTPSVVRGLEEEERALRGRAEAEEKEFALSRKKRTGKRKAFSSSAGSLDVLQEKIEQPPDPHQEPDAAQGNAAAKIDALKADRGRRGRRSGPPERPHRRTGQKPSTHEDQKSRAETGLAESEARLRANPGRAGRGRGRPGRAPRRTSSGKKTSG